MTCCTVATTKPMPAIGIANQSDTQKDAQFAMPANVRPTNVATTSHETHLRIANAATTAGVASNSPRLASGHTPITRMIESPHSKEAWSPSRPNSPVFEHNNDTSETGDIDAETANATAAKANPNQIALSTDTRAAYTGRSPRHSGNGPQRGAVNTLHPSGTVSEQNRFMSA